MSAAAWLNTAWMASCAAEAWAFRRATRRVAATQARLLAAIVRRNRATDFGRRHRFDLIRTPAEFQRAVPLTTADDYPQDDAAYLGTVEQWMLRRLLVTPPASVRHADIDTFRLATLVSLLGAPDLAFVSVWSPTFLTALLEPLDRERERLLAALPAGRRRE